MDNLIKEFKKAKSVGTPLIAINTSDQPNTVKILTDACGKMFPILTWDCLNGVLPRTDKAIPIKKFLTTTEMEYGGEKQQIEDLLKEPEKLLVALAQPKLCARPKADSPTLSENLIVILFNAHRILTGDKSNEVVQGLMNLRNGLSANGRTLVLLGPDFQLPSEISQDVYVITEPLPTEEEIKTTVSELYKEANIITDADTIATAASALKGLPPFAIKQAASLAVDYGKDDKPYVVKHDLWKRKKQMLDSIPGLSMQEWGPTFDDIGGLEEAKEFINAFFNGPFRPNVIVFIDEIEKMIAGARTDGGGDTSGVSQDQAQVLLNRMEQYKWIGHICLGPPGSGKSFFAECVASTHKIPLVVADFGAAKGSLMGQSEQRIRDVIRGIHAMAGQGGAYFIATCNKLDTISPELRRRFKCGLWFFDLPEETERVSIGKLQAKAHGVKDTPEFWKGKEGWSGANIRDCCFMAKGMNSTLEQASKRIVSASKQDAQGIDRLRRLAHLKFLSASHPGEYLYPPLLETDSPVVETVEQIQTSRKFQKGV